MPAPATAPQSAPVSSIAPSRFQNRSGNSIASALWLPALMNGRIAPGPSVATISPNRAAISASASSQPIGSNRPSPFAPTRRSGVVMRSGLYTRSRKRFTFGHSSPAL